jgi:hypothetical protein
LADNANRLFEAQHRELFLSEIRAILSRGGGFRIEIPPVLEKIDKNFHRGDAALTEVVFSADGRLRTICGFQDCIFLCRIVIPSSVEVIRAPAILGCAALREVTFTAGRRLTVISDFEGCAAVPWIEIPSAVTRVTYTAFRGCRSLEEMVLLATAA